MSKTWAEVVQDERFQKLDSATKEKVRQKYFEDVVAPRVQELQKQTGKPMSMDLVREKFDADTRYADFDYRQAQYEARPTGEVVDERLTRGMKQLESAKAMSGAADIASRYHGLREDYTDRMTAEDVPTGKYTSEGRPIVRNPDGSFSTERTITVTNPKINGGKPTNIPSMYNGKQVTQREAERIIIENGGVDPETGRKLEGFNSIDEAETSAKTRSASLAPQMPDVQRNQPLMRSAISARPGEPSDEAGRPLISETGKTMSSNPRVMGEALQRERDKIDRLLTISTKKGAEAAKIQTAPVAEEAFKANDFKTAWGYVKRDPVSFVGEVGTTSLPMMAEPLAKGSVAAALGGPWLGMLATGQGSYNVDFAAELQGALQRNGVDTNNIEAVRNALLDPQMYKQITKEARAHAAVVGLLDGLSFGLAGRTLVPKAVANVVARHVINVPVQTAVQGTMGAIGEGGGELAAGRPLEWGQILAEAAGEAITAPVDMVAASVGGIHEQRINTSRNRLKAAIDRLNKLAEENAPDSELQQATDAAGEAQQDYSRSVKEAFDIYEADQKTMKALEQDLGFSQLEKDNARPETAPDKVQSALENRAAERQVTGKEPTAMEAAFQQAEQKYGLNIAKAEEQTKANPQEPGVVNVQGLDIAIENPRGTVRTGSDKNGNVWDNTMENPYGHIKMTKGADGEEVDVFLGPNAENTDTVYVVDQKNPTTGKFDEHKAVLGVNSEEEARQVYMNNYSKDWKGLDSIVAMPIEEFKNWVQTGQKTEPVAAEYGLQEPKLSRGAQRTTEENIQMGQDKVGLTDDRIRNIFSEYAYPDGRVIAGMAYINPDDFVRATGNPRTIYGETGPLDTEELANEIQTPFLHISTEDGGIPKIVGHEGRHRMAALARAGIKEVPVVIKNVDAKYGTKTMGFTETYLQPQSYDQRNAEQPGKSPFISGLIDITYPNSEAIKQQFGEASQDVGVRMSRGNKAYYHGTNAEFDQFKTQEGVAGHFTRSRSVAKQHGKRVIKAKLDYKNPVTIMDEDWRTLRDKPELLKKLKRQGYDAAISDDTGDVIMFSPEGITIVPEKHAKSQADTLYRRTAKPRKFNAKGDLSGAPPGINSMQKRAGLVRRMLNILEDPLAQTPFTMEWYDRSGEAIRKAANGDRQTAENLVRLMSLYSQANQVGGNTTAAVKSIYEISRGNMEPEAGRFPNRTKKLVRGILEAPTMDVSVPGVDNKLMSFYMNLHDATFGTNYFDNASTQDRWMLRLFGYPESADGVRAGAGQYAFAHDLTIDITEAYNAKHGTSYLPREVQAGLWFYARNSDAAKKVKGKFVPPAPVDFATYLNRATESVTWEARPSVSSGMFPGIHTASTDEVVDFNQAMLDVITGRDGQDMVIEKLGAPLARTEQSMGSFELAVSPNMLTHIVAEKIEGAYDPQLADLYANIVGMIFTQDAVPWHRADPTLTGKKAAVGLQITADRPITDQMAMEFYDHSNQFLPGVEFTLVDGKLRFINFRNENGKPFLTSDKDFIDKMTKVVHTFTGFDIPEFTQFKAEGGYHSNDWTKATEGQEYAAKISELGRPDLLPWIRDRRQAAIEAGQTVARKYGWNTSYQGPLAAPVPLSRLNNPDAALTDVYGRFGAINPGKDSTDSLKIYNLDTLVDDPTLVENLLNDFGYQVKYFAFHEDPEAGVEFAIPKLKKQGYKDGVLWIYDPRVAHGSFKDTEYTRQWRIVHELAHGITEDIMQAKYGDGRREGRMGRTWVSKRGKPPKQIDFEVAPLTLAQAQRAVEWEDVTFRVQRMLMEELGIDVNPVDFAREYNTNISDALYRVLTGDFGDPGEFGFDPSGKLPEVKAILQMLESTEQDMARTQGRQPTKGVDLTSWKRTSREELQAAINAQRLNQPKMARKAAKRGMSVSKIYDSLRHIMNTWTNIPDIEVLDSFDQLPNHLQDFLRSQNAEDETDGLFDTNTGKVYMIADRIGSPEHAQRLLFHEMIGHYGLRQLLEPKQIEPLLLQIFNAEVNKPRLRSIAREYDLDLRTREGRLVAAEEFLAHEAEINPRASWVQRAISLVRQFLRKFFPSLKVTDTEITGLLGRMKLAVRAGRNKAMQEGRAMASRSKEGGNLSDGPFAVPRETLWRSLVRKLQDKYDRLRVIQELPDVTVDPETDAYLKEELYHGKVEYELEKFEDLYVKPLLQAVSESDITLDQLDEFLYAMHAPERNAHIQEINPTLREQGVMGSGMTDAEAEAIIQIAKNDGTYNEKMELAKLVYRINNARLKLLKKAGLEPQKNIDMWSEKYGHYVPLRGFYEEDGGLFQRIGRGFSIKGRESKRALGRRSRADSPIIYSILQMEETIIRAEKNTVGQAFLNFVRDNPNPDLWQVIENPEDVPTRPVYDERTAEVAYRRDPFFKLADDVMSVKIDGQEKYIKIKDPLLARAMTNVGVEKAGAIVQTLAAFNRFLAAVNTAYNPEFVISNAARDIQTALINLQARTEVDPSELAKRMIKDIPSSVKGIYQGLRNPEHGSEWVQWFRRFSESGGKIGFFGLETIESKRARLNNDIRMLEGDNYAKVLRVVKGVKDYVMDVNASVENAARLAVFKNAIEMGMSDQQAATIAKNLTVNFNRKGELGTLANALYLFYNASVQGTATMWKAAKSPRVQKVLAGIAVAAFGLTELNRLMAGIDKDGENCYDKIPDWIKRRNLIVMNPLGECQDRFQFPLPYGYNVPHVVGMSISDAIHAPPEKLGKVAVNIAVTLIDSFNPIGNSDSDYMEVMLAKMISPTITDPIVDLATNENFMGSPIMPDQPAFGPQIPDSQRYWSSVNPATKWFAEQLNSLTGGSKYESGLIDISPETMDHWINFVTGGAGAFISRMGVEYPTLMYNKLAYGDEIPYNKVPFARKVIGERTEWDVPRAFYDQRTEVEQITKAHQKMKKEVASKEDALLVRDFERNNYELIWMGEHQMKRFNEQIKKLNTEIHYLQNKEDMPKRVKHDRIKALKARREKVMQEFSRIYNKMKKKRYERLSK